MQIGDETSLEPNAFEPYSVLMSVYEKEEPLFLRQSVESMFAQSVLPEQFVLVIDGPVPEALESEINVLCERFDITLCPLSQNVGLGKALNAGLSVCRNEIVARMDSDDIAFPDRIEMQLELMQRENADIVSAVVAEFEQSTDRVTAARLVPETHDEIMKYVRKRNPFNHPAVVYKKSVVESVGGYQDYPLFEDYELFARALANGAVGANVQQPLVYMRAGSGMYDRRGGREYAKKILRFYKRLRQLSLCGFKENITCVLPRAAVALAPAPVRRFVYKIFLRH
ncbi:MAG: glycosyltransferase [Oscillospiraceae bacterium]|nr:glycosyltransferase [Oscillospiraceae bacterium]